MPSVSQVRKRVRELEEQAAFESGFKRGIVAFIESRMKSYARNSLTWRELNSLRLRILNQ